MVSSVNEWGADQTRILLLTNEAVHRVKYNFHSNAVVSWHSTPLTAIQRVEYGSFRAAGCVRAAPLDRTTPQLAP